MIMELEKKLEGLVKRYAESLKAILNITVSQCKKPESEFKIQGRFYKKCIDQSILEHWIKRHAFIDVLELTRELMLIVFANDFSKPILFEEKKKTAKINKESKKLSPCEFLRIFSIENDFKVFCDLYKEYNNFRNCLVHRFGTVTEHDNAPFVLPILVTSC